MPANVWPREAMDYLVQSWRDGWSFSELAERINERFGVCRTRSAIAGKVARMALKTTEPRTRVAPKAPRAPRKIVALSAEASPRPAPRCDHVLPPTIWKNLLELVDSDCHYPFGETVPFPFCGLPAIPGLPWCPYHAKLCYNHPKGE